MTRSWRTRKASSPRTRRHRCCASWLASSERAGIAAEDDHRHARPERAQRRRSPAGRKRVQRNIDLANGREERRQRHDRQHIDAIAGDAVPLGGASTAARPCATALMCAFGPARRMAAHVSVAVSDTSVQSLTLAKVTWPFRSNGGGPGSGMKQAGDGIRQSPSPQQNSEPGGRAGRR